jgi:hypothetical protein
LTYQYGKESSKESSAESRSDSTFPYHRLLLDAAGLKQKAPRLTSAINTWRRSCREEIEVKANSEAAKLGKDRSMLASVREQVAKKMFERLSAKEQNQWASQAKKEHEDAMKVWKEQALGLPSMGPAEYQRW